MVSYTKYFYKMYGKIVIFIENNFLILPNHNKEKMG